MNYKFTKNFLIKKIIKFVLLLFNAVIFAQISISQPNLGFTQICASSSFNTFNLTFTFGPVSNLNPGNQFLVELSNTDGVFSSPILLATSSVITSPVSINFSIPENLNGNNYRIRIRSTSPAISSPPSVSFAITYAIYNLPFTINNGNSNVSVCDASSYTLAIDSGSNSPLNIGGLTYQWFRNNTLIAGETGPTIQITQNGSYFAKVNYGTCNFNAFSNLVNINFVEGLTVQLSSLQDFICPGSSVTISSSLNNSGFLYSWYKNNLLVTTSNSSNFSVSEPGVYKVVVDNGVCLIESNSLELTFASIESSLNVSNNPIILPSQSLLLQVNTNAQNPSYEWYKDNILITGATSSSLLANQVGEYKVKVTQNTNCILFDELTVNISFPSNYNLLINYSNTYVTCQNLSEMLGIDVFNTVINTQTINLLEQNIPLEYQWFKDGELLSSSNNNTLLIDNIVDNGIYQLQITLSDQTIISSNLLEVKLKFDIQTQLQVSGNLCDSNSVVLISSSVNIQDYQYQWFKTTSNEVLSTTSECLVNEVGSYFVVISYFGCSITSLPILVESLDVSQFTLNFQDVVEIFEGESIEVVANGASFYEWFFEGNLISTSTSVIVNSAGILEVYFYFADCLHIIPLQIIIIPPVENQLIPNVITPNNDSINDVWILPEAYAFKEDTQVIIFDSQNNYFFKTNNYQNNWPLESVDLSNKIFYYIIKNPNELIRGTLTIITNEKL